MTDDFLKDVVRVEPEEVKPVNEAAAYYYWIQEVFHMAMVLN